MPIGRALNTNAVVVAAVARRSRAIAVVQALDARIQILVAERRRRLTVARRVVALTGRVIANLIAVAKRVIRATVRKNTLSQKADVRRTRDAVIALRIVHARPSLHGVEAQHRRQRAHPLKKTQTHFPSLLSPVPSQFSGLHFVPPSS